MKPFLAPSYNADAFNGVRFNTFHTAFYKLRGKHHFIFLLEWLFGLRRPESSNISWGNPRTNKYQFGILIHQNISAPKCILSRQNIKTVKVAKTERSPRSEWPLFSKSGSLVTWVDHFVHIRKFSGHKQIKVSLDTIWSYALTKTERPWNTSLWQ